MDTGPALRNVKAISPYQFALFRIIFGTYLVWHFICLLPYGEELFSHTGAFSNPVLSPTYKFFPNAILLFDRFTFGVPLFISILLVFSILILIGRFRRLSALLLWYGWACLVNRNPLISNPSIPYVGLMLLFFSLIPPGEPFSKATLAQKESWHFPRCIYLVAWALLGIGYTFSGLVKLQSPSWVDGTAMTHLASNPLARPGVLRDLFLGLPAMLTAAATYFALAGEILFLPLSATRRTRFFAWSWMCLVHIGILCMVAFADLTLGMLLMHLFVFDPEWLQPKTEKRGKIVVFFDGVCGLCDRTVNLLLSEDKAEILKFSSLQGEAAKKLPRAEAESIVVIDGYGSDAPQILRGSSAVLRVLDSIGGFWRVISLLRFVPLTIREKVYYFIARNRYQWFGKHAECRLVRAEERRRFID